MRQERLLRLLLRINESEPVDPRSVAIMLTEMHFRGRLFRLSEILYLVVGMIFFPNRLRNVTVGKCQAGLSYWRSSYGDRIFPLVQAIMSDKENYYVCSRYLSEINPPSHEQAIIVYNGRPSRLYAQVYKRNLHSVVFLIQKLQIRQMLPA